MSALPQPIDRTIATRFEGESKSFSEKAKELKDKRISELNANLAEEYDTEARNWWTQAEAKRVELKAPMLESIRRHDQFWGEMMATALAVRKEAKRLIVGWEIERRAKIAEQRRIDEATQRAEAERQRKAEADHLMEIAAATNDPAALEAAIEVENTPIAPVISTVDTSAGKVPGSSVTLKKTGKIVDIRAFLLGAMGITIERVFEQMWHANDIDQFRDEDAQRLAQELLFSKIGFLLDVVEIKDDPAEVGPALKINQSALDDKLNRGIEIPGVQVMERAITRNMSRG